MKNTNLKSSNYTPYQPGLEKSVNYHNFVVQDNNPLFGIVSDFYQFDSVTAIHNEIYVLPDGCIDFIFKYSEEGLIKTVEGFYREKIILPINQNGCAFGVRFLPGALTNILKVYTSELIGNVIPLMDLMENDSELSRMDEAMDFNLRIGIMTNYILKKIKKSYDSSEIVHYCIKRILTYEGRISILELAKETSYTIRYLRQLFHKHVGISPKELCEIIKFQASFVKISNLQKNNIECSLSNFAIQSGYYDQSHMNKSYQKIAGCLPKKLYSEIFTTKKLLIH